jgi:putative peptidoglycan lipid II flippase
MNKQMLKKKTISVGASTLASRLLGLLRETLMSHYLGAEADAFITAFKIPNSLRKIFAEGALSASFIPSIVQLVKKDQSDEVNGLMTLSFLVFEGFLCLICLFIFIKADWIMRIIAPGWYNIPHTPYTGIGLFDTIMSNLVALWYNLGQAAPQALFAIIYLKILIGFIVLLSMSALLTGPLQAVNHFFVPAIAPVLLNLFFIGGVSICLYCQLSVEYLCAAIMLGGVAQFLLHLHKYFQLQFSFSGITSTTWKHFRHILLKFFPVLAAMSIMEINFFIDTSFGSLLPYGSISCIYYANRFMQIPLGVFAIALSTILLPHFSRITLYAPKRLEIYLFETAKFIFWVIVPVSLLFGFFSEKIFSTLFLSKKFTTIHVYETSWIMIILLVGLFFFSLNKILLNVYYSFHNTRIPMYITFIEIITHFVLNYIFVARWGTYGITASTVIVGILRTILLALGLYLGYNLRFYLAHFSAFAAKSLAQLFFVSMLFFACYKGWYILIDQYSFYPDFFLNKIGFWLWAGPLCISMAIIMTKTRHLFGIRLYFLD